MENLETLKATVKNGKAVLNLPYLIDGTKLELRIISSEIQEPSNQQLIESNDSINDFDKNSTNHTIYFEDLNLIEPLLKAILDEGYKYPSPIQAKSIPIALNGKDIIATAKTGSGKTAAFSLPIIQHLSTTKFTNTHLRALILAPTRELASQIGQSLADYAKYTKIQHITIYGGVSQKPQVRDLQRGKQILVATPGRLLDLIGQGYIDISRIDIFVLDEADRMLDMGFIRDIKKLLKIVPDNCQKMLFSATMPPQITKLADQFLVDPVRVSVDPPATTVETIDSLVYFVEKSNKLALLIHLIKTERITKTLVFMRTKYSANKIVRKLKKEGISAGAIHGNKSQNARERALSEFKNGDFSVLVATDIAARGIDIDDITHIINFDMSNEAETYVHRIGRTARAGKSGIAYNFCAESERPYLIKIEQLIKKHLIRAVEYPFSSKIPTPSFTDLDRKNGKNKLKRSKKGLKNKYYSRSSKQTSRKSYKRLKSIKK